MAHKRRARVRYHMVRGGHYGTFGPRYLGYRIPVGGRHYKRRSRSRANPFLGNPGSGGSKLLLYGALAVGAFFVLRGGALGHIFGSAAPPGYTQLGSSSYYRGPDGQLYTRTATGGMMLSPTQAPVGSAVEQQLIAAGSRLALPIVGGIAQGLSTLIGNLFSNQGGGVVPGIPSDAGTVGGAGTTTTAPDVLSGAYNAPLPPLPDLPALTTSLDTWTAPDTSGWFPSGTYTLGAPATVAPVFDTSLTLTPLPDLTPVGYMGFGDLMPRAHPSSGYGFARRSPSGEVEARFLRQAPRYN
jgi:hypothetical protein